MTLCVPDEKGYEVRALEEVADYREDDQMFDREFARNMKYVNRNPDDLQARWMAAHYSNLMQRRDVARELIAENLSTRSRDHTRL